ncbi:hypothetical protein QCA50_020300 [Cerrena zonata]|uniref:Uncharacterized protein n=1 Tax=Cerrena zonata TaxID=2478898 RepID=A0AAW0FBZ9_9APHY
MQARIQLARQIDAIQQVKKENHEKHGLREAPEAMEIEINSGMGLSDDDDSRTYETPKEDCRYQDCSLESEA